MTPAALAAEAKMEVDDVLLALWDARIEYPVSPDSRIQPADVEAARRACGVASVRDRLTIQYWLDSLDMSRSEFTTWANEHSVRITPDARRLPKGALAKLERARGGVLRETAPAARAAVSDHRVESPPLKDLRWWPVGLTRTPMQYLSASEVEAIHFQIAEDFQYTSDPIAPAGVLRRNQLESAITRPETGAMGALKYPTVELAGAALTHSLVQNHPFHNGNKRTALVSLLAFLDRNSVVLDASQDDVFRWMLRIASHRLGHELFRGDKNDNEVFLMAQWLSSQCRGIETGERVITFAELNRCLHAHGCDVRRGPSREAKMFVERDVTVEGRGIFRSKPTTERRKVVLKYGGEGRQVPREKIREIRKTLQLSEEFGVDSRAFYSSSEKSRVDGFIGRYRKTLSRLARL
ncbi:type II toxin-antitoxin system death-on-curing family toxin [Agrococcus terreus]|uniref:type II toxin-antitoxin system death-on-curing family toxin n=1 Tax=Agrococcus terreus TaxID=574649 RepID=UPI00384B313C